MRHDGVGLGGAALETDRETNLDGSREEGLMDRKNREEKRRQDGRRGGKRRRRQAVDCFLAREHLQACQGSWTDQSSPPRRYVVPRGSPTQIQIPLN